MKALIIDDEPMPARYLESLIQQHCFEVRSVDLIHSPVAALTRLEQHRYDLVFLDVEMPELDGFALLERARLPFSTQVIFTTAYSEYALEAFRANAAHYLLKPVVKADLLSAVAKASRLLPGRGREVVEEPVVSVFYQKEHHIFKAREILRFEARGSYSQVVLAERELLVSKGLAHFEEKLDPHGFFRCHHSHLVNLAEVVRMGRGKGSYLVLRNGDVVPVASGRKDGLEARMGL